MKWRLFVCAAIALLILAVPLLAFDSSTSAQTPPTATPAPPTTPDQEALRKQFASFVGGMQDVVAAMKQNPVTAQALTASGSDPTAGLANVSQQIPQLDSNDLAALQTAVTQNPNWQQIPSTLKSAVASVPHASAAPLLPLQNGSLSTLSPARPSRQLQQQTAQSPFVAFVHEYNGSATRPATLSLLNPLGVRAAPAIADDTTGTFVSSCDSIGSAPDFNASSDFQAMVIANQVQSALQAIMLATPGVIAVFIGVDVPTGVKIAEAVLWGAANVAFLVLSQVEAIALDCSQNYFQNAQQATWPTDPTNASTFVPGSSELSIKGLIDQSNGTQAEIQAVQSTIETILNCQILGNTSGPGGGASCPIGLNAQASNLNTTLSDDNTRLEEVQDDVFVTLQPDLNVLNNTLNTVLTKAKQAITNLNTFQVLQVRMEIEANLSLHGNSPLGLFETPTADGGYLEVVGSIVNDTITKEIASGKGVFNAQSYFNQALAAYHAGQFKSAYGFYVKAYGDATK